MRRMRNIYALRSLCLSCTVFVSFWWLLFAAVHSAHICRIIAKSWFLHTKKCNKNQTKKDQDKREREKEKHQDFHIQFAADIRTGHNFHVA